MVTLLVGLVDTAGRTVLPHLFREFLPPQFASAAGPAVGSIMIYLLMAVVLFVRPQGLFPAAAAVDKPPPISYSPPHCFRRDSSVGRAEDS